MPTTEFPEILVAWKSIAISVTESLFSFLLNLAGGLGKLTARKTNNVYAEINPNGVYCTLPNECASDCNHSNPESN